MSILNEMRNFYYKMSMHELKAMNDEEYYKGLSYNSMLYINIISQLENCTVSKLSEILCVTKSAVTIKINELVKFGAIEKVQCQNDKRVFYVSLSSSMKKTMTIYDNVISKIEEDLIGRYSEQQLKTFSEILHTFANSEWGKIENGKQSK